MRYLLSFLILIIQLVAFGQSVVINGIAPTYVGERIEAYSIEDYLSNKEKLVSSTTVREDSTFTLYLSLKKTQKIVLKSKNNKGFLFIQPDTRYNIGFPEKDPYSPTIAGINEVEVGFFKLDSADINYKILGFQRWVDHFIGNFYHLKSTKPIEFSEALDRFKTNAEKAYKTDTSYFFKVYVRYTMAGLDNIRTSSERNRYEKYDFYLKSAPVEYMNEAYMSYLSGFYQEMIPRLSNKTNEAVYNGVINSSPTLIVKALGTEYTLSNLRLRELVMINMLTEAYHKDEFPKTNILTILDSLSNRTFYPENKLIAKNLSDRLTEVAPGGKAPNFALIADSLDPLTLPTLSGKHVYLHFFDPRQENNVMEIQLLRELHEKYSDYVHFVSIYNKEHELNEMAKQELQNIPWHMYPIDQFNSIWKNYKIGAMSHYTLIDAAGYVVANPALKPTPNGQYSTIDKTFFYIKKHIDSSK